LTEELTVVFADHAPYPPVFGQMSKPFCNSWKKLRRASILPDPLRDFQGRRAKRLLLKA
jgi:hypothetical protein